MNFGFSDDQQAIKRTARDFLAARYPLATVRSSPRTTAGSPTSSGRSWSSSGGPG